MGTFMIFKFGGSQKEQENSLSAYYKDQVYKNNNDLSAPKFSVQCKSTLELSHTESQLMW
ncbi:hypothetical protein QJS04_geneDACA001122 [Acorus gramineus]|uniref:Uncharacterized protein n=1 Tax=Acorus gramineus TaxID=55184 RepID=A0AAV9AB70_ACOGR|nr:hypothetical protein QJS04_geneDACA001122 [Acorus gramineus]